MEAQLGKKKDEASNAFLLLKKDAMIFIRGANLSNEFAFDSVSHIIRDGQNASKMKFSCEHYS